jgi:hypothetical protein
MPLTQTRGQLTKQVEHHMTVFTMIGPFLSDVPRTSELTDPFGQLTRTLSKALCLAAIALAACVAQAPEEAPAGNPFTHADEPFQPPVRRLAGSALDGFFIRPRLLGSPGVFGATLGERYVFWSLEEAEAAVEHTDTNSDRLNAFTRDRIDGNPNLQIPGSGAYQKLFRGIIRLEKVLTVVPAEKQRGFYAQRLEREDPTQEERKQGKKGKVVNELEYWPWFSERVLRDSALSPELKERLETIRNVRFLTDAEQLPPDYERARAIMEARTGFTCTPVKEVDLTCEAGFPARGHQTVELVYPHPARGNGLIRITTRKKDTTHDERSRGWIATEVVQVMNLDLVVHRGSPQTGVYFGFSNKVTRTIRLSHPFGEFPTP